MEEMKKKKRAGTMDVQVSNWNFFSSPSLKKLQFPFSGFSVFENSTNLFLSKIYFSLIK